MPRNSIRSTWFAVALGTLVSVSAFPARAADEAKSEDSNAKAGEIVFGLIEIAGNYPEGAVPLGLFGELHEGMADGVARLDKAAADEKLTGVILKINNPTIGWGKLNEFRQAIARARQKGKKVYAWLDGGSSMDYMLATACDDITMPESAALMLLGLRAEVTFYKNLFDMLAIKAEMLRVGKYKAAAEPYTRTEMSPEFREEMEAILEDYYHLMVKNVAESRKLTPEVVKAAIDAGPLTAADAKSKGMIDRVAYEDAIQADIKDKHPGAKLKFVKKYGKKKSNTDFSGFGGMVKFMELLMGVEQPQKKSSAPKIAVIYATGPIMPGVSRSDIFGDATMGADTIIKAIRQAKDDDTVKALVLRVDSPGGSALASDLMWHELDLVKKPFVVSMGDTAASGGYYIAMGAQRIFAEPGTLTGSIGVVGGKLALKGLFEKVGITTSVISRGKNSGVMSFTESFTDSEREAMVRLLNDVYDQFTSKAAKGRKMDKAKLLELAGGRVYTGNMALERKLVDELGTLDDAIASAKQMAGLKPDDKLEKLILPKPVSPIEALFGPMDTSAGTSGNQARIVKQVLESIAPELGEQVQALATFRMFARDPRLTLMPFRLRVK